MDLAPRLSPGHLVAVAAVVGAMACAGCSSPGEVHAVSHATRAPEVRGTRAPEERSTPPAVASEGKSTHQRTAAMTKAEVELRRGIKSYEDAEYEAAARSLRSAVNRGLQTPEDKVRAYKYLAFVACTSNRIKSCQAEFRKALDVDPTFELAPAEAGHPIWGPVFHNAKLDMTAKAKTRKVNVAGN